MMGSIKIEREAKRARVEPITLMLMKVAEHGFTTEAEDLIKDGVDVNGLNFRTEKTPLVLASENGHTETACLLIKYGADIEGVKDYYSPLASAAENGHTETVGMLIENGANINKIIDSDTSILSLASKNGHNDTVKLLIQNGADVNIEEEDPALKWAVGDGLTDVARTLIEGGANKDYQDYSGCSLLETAIITGKTDVAKLLIEKGASVDGALLQAFENKNAEIIKILMKQDIGVKQKDKYGNTLLILATIGGETELMTDLIDKGSDIEEKDNDGTTALMIAAFEGCVEAIEILIKKGADLNKKAINGRTALMFASLNGYQHFDVIEKLIKHGASVNDTCQNRMTALMYASQIWRTDILKLLIDKGADLNVQDKNGDTALILATKVVQLQNMKILIDSGADVSIRGKDGLSARSIAMMSKDKRMLRLFDEKSSIVSQDNIQKHEAIKSLIGADTKSPGKCLKINEKETSIKPEKYDENMSQVLSTDIQHLASGDKEGKKDLKIKTKENLGSAAQVKLGLQGMSLFENHLKLPMLSSLNNLPNVNTRQMQGAENSSHNQINQLVFNHYKKEIVNAERLEDAHNKDLPQQNHIVLNCYHIGHVDHAHLDNPMCVNITDAKYCVIGDKT